MISTVPDDYFSKGDDERAKLSVLEAYDASGMLPRNTYEDRSVLDWECGVGLFAITFKAAGARSVVASDTWLDRKLLDRLPEQAAKAVRFEKATIFEIADRVEAGEIEPFDLVFSNTATEHLVDLPGQIAAAYRVLRSGGHFFTNHDNYYQPAGCHDHGMLQPKGKRIGPAGPACWQDDRRCEASAAYRRELLEKRPWAWTGAFEETTNHQDCRGCAYFKRSQPWAHLLYQSDFATHFPESYRFNRALNKLTPFQLRQSVIEAGFKVLIERFPKVENEPPQILLSGPYGFTVDTLTTWMVRILARKP